MVDLSIMSAAVKLPLLEKSRAAMLGAAVGDALGWPQEDRAQSLKTHRTGVVSDEFVQWSRKAGGRFHAHEEVILPGEYSDDTQLILATARSLLKKNWTEHLTRGEFPTWYLTHRGAGGATLRAVEGWLDSGAPWLNKDAKKLESYFNAGGNGVVMRVLPHVIWNAQDASFSAIASDVFSNGITTHGHPRALVGAALYAYSLWESIRLTGTLGYGDLVERILSEVRVWSSLPESFETNETFKARAMKSSNAGYARQWRAVVEETESLLLICREGLKMGALSVDGQILERLGAFDRRTNGAGTVTAAAAVFLASRYASNPKVGTLEAAFAKGADTDTLASMVGGLLGAIAGDNLNVSTGSVQDAPYIANISDRLVQKSIDAEDTASYCHTRSATKALQEAIAEAEIGNEFVLPDGRVCHVRARNELKSFVRSEKTISTSLYTRDGQLLYCKRTHKPKPARVEGQQLDLIRANESPPLYEVSALGMRVKVFSANLDKARLFYEKVVGLQALRSDDKQVLFTNNLSLIFRLVPAGTIPIDDTRAEFRRATVQFRVSNLDFAYENAKLLGVIIVKDIDIADSARYFRCIDPDRNVVEIYEGETP